MNKFRECNKVKMTRGDEERIGTIIEVGNMIYIGSGIYERMYRIEEENKSSLFYANERLLELLNTDNVFEESLNKNLFSKRVVKTTAFRRYFWDKELVMKGSCFQAKRDFSRKRHFLNCHNPPAFSRW